MKHIILIPLCLLLLGAGCTIGEPCVYETETAIVTSVYFSPETFSRRWNEWTGSVEKEDGTSTMYEVSYPVEVGDTLTAKRGCGYLNQPF